MRKTKAPEKKEAMPVWKTETSKPKDTKAKGKKAC